MENGGIEHNETHNDDSSNLETIDDETTTFAPQVHETLVVETIEATGTPIVVVSEMEETGPRVEEAAPAVEETAAMTVEVAPVIENRIIVHEYPNSWIVCYPPFGELLPYHT